MTTFLTFSGGWKDRILTFGKEDGYSIAALTPFVAAHKLTALAASADRASAAWENAAHASVTGTGLLFVLKAKAIEVPLSIIRLVVLDS